MIPTIFFSKHCMFIVVNLCSKPHRHIFQFEWRMKHNFLKQKLDVFIW